MDCRIYNPPPPPPSYRSRIYFRSWIRLPLVMGETRYSTVSPATLILSSYEGSQGTIRLRKYQQEVALPLDRIPL